MTPLTPPLTLNISEFLLTPLLREMILRFHYGFLYAAKRGFRQILSQILKASSTCISHIPWSTIDGPIY